MVYGELNGQMTPERLKVCNTFRLEPNISKAAVDAI